MQDTFMPDGAKSPEELLADFTNSIVTGEEAKRRATLTKPKSKGTFHDTEGSHPPVRGPKTAGQATSNSGFAKGKTWGGGT